jgi:hypothetical protein
MAGRFSMNRNMALQGWSERACGLGPARPGGCAVRPVTVSRWCRPRIGARRGRGLLPRCIQSPRAD